MKLLISFLIALIACFSMIEAFVPPTSASMICGDTRFAAATVVYDMMARPQDMEGQHVQLEEEDSVTKDASTAPSEKGMNVTQKAYWAVSTVSK